MFAVQINNPAHGLPFQMVSTSAPFAGVPNLSPLPTVTIAKDCGPFQPAIGQVIELGNGWYALLGHPQDRNTLGTLVVHGECADAGVQCIDATYRVVPWNPDAQFDSDDADALLAEARQTNVYLKVLANSVLRKWEQFV